MTLDDFAAMNGRTMLELKRMLLAADEYGMERTKEFGIRVIRPGIIIYRGEEHPITTIEEFIRSL